MAVLTAHREGSGVVDFQDLKSPLGPATDRTISAVESFFSSASIFSLLGFAIEHAGSIGIGIGLAHVSTDPCPWMMTDGGIP